jgi:uncharacterized protein YegP (UPF0339 family)
MAAATVQLAEGASMAGTFVIETAGAGEYRFRLTADDGTVVAVSPSFSNIKAVTAGITAVRESAATGFVVDRRRP